MKKYIVLLLTMFAFSCATQKNKNQEIILQKSITKSGTYLRLQSAYNDSRCPQGTECIWAGEVSATIEVYKDKKIVEEKMMIFNSKNKEENIKWFENYFSKKIKSIQMLPYPKDGSVINKEDYFIEILYLE